ncbi:hypothetical protein MK079_03915 [Candidatus Gracilibacteria bacterium]|nr:hypothetical protein [Candidatus Gracilibacteria bacterium]
MKNVFVISVNIVLYIVYVLLLSLLFSFAFPQILAFLDRPLLSVHDPFFDKVQIVIMVLVLVISAIFRKYFYLSLSASPALTPSSSPTEKGVKESPQPPLLKGEQEEEELKIYIDKEKKSGN